MRNQNAIPYLYGDLLYLLLLVGFFYNLGLGHYPLFTPDEGRYSEVAREMVAMRDYVTPRINGIAFLDKPVLYYWLQALSIHLFGLSEWALRFFPMLAGLALSMSTYLFARCFFDRRAALLSAFILATSPLIFGASHYANLDLEVALFITLSLYAGMIALYRVPFFSPALYASAMFAGLAVLTKGLIGLFFPGVLLGVMYFYLRRFKIVTVKSLLISAVIFLVIVLPWYIAVQIKNPQFFHYFFIVQHVTRFLSQAEFNNKTPFWFYLPVVFLGFFPWSLFLYHAIKGASLDAWRHLERRVIILFLLLFAVVVFVFFSIPHSKMVGYILPIFPPLALLVGWYLSTSWETLFRMRYRMWAFSALLFASLLLLLSLPFMASSFNTQSSKRFAATLKPLMHADTEVITYFDYFYDLPLYLQRTVQVVADWKDPGVMKRDNWRRELALGAPFQNVSAILLNEETFWQKWHGPYPVYVVMFQSDFRQFKTKAQYYYIVISDHDRVVVANRKVT